MSGLHPYCIVTAGVHPPSGLTGLFARPVVGHDIDAFTVWASTLDRPPRAELEQISQHHQVVHVASTATSALPVRFGAWASSIGELTDRVSTRKDALHASLGAVSDRAELGVTIEDRRSTIPGDAAEAAPVEPRTYLRNISREHAARRRRRMERERLIDDLRSALGAMPIDERAHPVAPPRLVSMAFLIPCEDEAPFRERVALFAEAHGCADRVHVTGPWPPYSFAVA